MTLCSAWEPTYDQEVCIPCEAADDFDQNTYDSFLLQASELIYLADMQKYPGLCTTTIKPCSRKFALSSFNSSTPTFASQAARSLGLYIACTCHAYDDCSCEYLSSILLPDVPATDILSVTIDGEAFTDYQLSGQLAQRTDDLTWPCCDIEITYTYGIDPPLLGKQAAAALACELYKLCSPDTFPGSTCRLPRNIASMSRQGIQVLFDTAAKGPMTFGIPEVDLYLRTSNPYGSRQFSSILSPDNFPHAKRIP